MKSRVQQDRQTTASYYTWTRSKPVHQTIRTRLTGYESDLSSEDGCTDHSYVNGCDGTSFTTNIILFHSRPVGPPHIGLRFIKLANKKIDKLISYRTYWLMIVTDSWSSRDSAEVLVHNKNFSLTIKRHVFDRDDPIKIFHFLTRFMNVADMLNKSYAQAFIALPIYWSTWLRHTFVSTSVERPTTVG